MKITTKEGRKTNEVNKRRLVALLLLLLLLLFTDPDNYFLSDPIFMNGS